MGKIPVLIFTLLIAVQMPAGALAQGWAGNLSGFAPQAAIGGPSFFAGYMEDRRGISFSLGADETGINGISGMKHTFPLRGLFLAVSQPISVNDLIGVSLGGSWLVPSRSRSEETYEFTVAVPGERSWQAIPQWWTIEANCNYRMGPGSWAVAGVRYENFSTNFKNPNDDAFIASLPTDRADVTMNNILPYVGVVVGVGSPAAAMTFSLVGFPAVPGSVRYKQTEGNVVGGPGRYEGSGFFNSGYFLEAYTDFSARIIGAKVGGFAKWSIIEGRAKMNFDSNDAVFGPLTDSFGFSVSRQVWVLGGKVKIDFGLPLGM